MRAANEEAGICLADVVRDKFPGMVPRMLVFRSSNPCRAQYVSNMFNINSDSPSSP